MSVQQAGVLGAVRSLERCKLGLAHPGPTGESSLLPETWSSLAQGRFPMSCISTQRSHSLLHRKKEGTAVLLPWCTASSGMARAGAPLAPIDTLPQQSYAEGEGSMGEVHPAPKHIRKPLLHHYLPSASPNCTMGSSLLTGTSFPAQ